MADESIYSDLNESEWRRISRFHYLIKYKFYSEGYSIFVTDLKKLYGENVNENEVQRRFSNLNAHAKMKTSVIIRNLENALNMALNGEDSTLKLDSSEEGIKILVCFIVNKASLNFNLDPQLLPMDLMRSHILVPSLSQALLTYFENIALRKRVRQLEENPRNESAPKGSYLDHRKYAIAFSLMSDKNVSEDIIIDSFLYVQSAIKASFEQRKKIVELRENWAKKRTTLKKEGLPDPTVPIKFSEVKDESDVNDPSTSQLQLPVKRELSSQNLNEEENVNQVCNEAPLNPEKTKKKKILKF